MIGRKDQTTHYEAKLVWYGLFKLTKLYSKYNPFRLSVSEMVNYLKIWCRGDQFN